MHKRISAAILAVFATSIVACGTMGAGADGRIQDNAGSGGAYLTADNTHGVNAVLTGGHGAAGSMSEGVQGTLLQP